MITCFLKYNMFKWSLWKQQKTLRETSCYFQFISFELLKQNLIKYIEKDFGNDTFFGCKSEMILDQVKNENEI